MTNDPRSVILYCHSENHLNMAIDGHVVSLLYWDVDMLVWRLNLSWSEVINVLRLPEEGYFGTIIGTDTSSLDVLGVVIERILSLNPDDLMLLY